jgi:hypothetical protein
VINMDEEPQEPEQKSSTITYPKEMWEKGVL